MTLDRGRLKQAVVMPLVLAVAMPVWAFVFALLLHLDLLPLIGTIIAAPFSVVLGTWCIYALLTIKAKQQQSGLQSRSSTGQPR